MPRTIEIGSKKFESVSPDDTYKIPSNYGEWNDLLSKIAGGQPVEDLEEDDYEEEHGVGVTIPRVRVPAGMRHLLGDRARVRVEGNYTEGFLVQARGVWPHRLQIDAEISAERLVAPPPADGHTRIRMATSAYNTFLFRPRHVVNGQAIDSGRQSVSRGLYMDGIAETGPKIRGPEYALSDLLHNAAIASAKSGLNTPVYDSPRDQQN